MAIYRAKKGILLAKAESSYGVDPSPTITSLIAAEDVVVEKSAVNIKNKALVGIHGDLPDINYEGPCNIKFKTHLRVPGTAGNTPDIASLLKACSFDETISAGVSVTYELELTDGLLTPSVAFYFYDSGRFCKALGCVGKVKINAKAQDLVMLEWEFTGFWLAADIADEGYPSMVGVSALDSPAIFKSAEFNFNSYQALIENLACDFGISVGRQVSANAATGVARYRVQDFAPKIDFDPEVVALSAFNPWTLWLAGTLAVLSAYFKSSSGQVQLSMTGLQSEVPKEGEREEAQIYQMSAACKTADFTAGYVARLIYT
ncbi:MAG: hypothetical protein RDU76_11585 [Candidatus Edwardsbacteria bacterium]|nr:hypothetical protein [Candidatus Edwardsbacteria bacterium]